MSHFHFPSSADVQSLFIRNVNEVFSEQSTFGQRASDKVAKIVGSWPFILVQSVIFILWIILNAAALVYQWDPYPFILMNLVLSMEAAFTAPIIMMSQNRQAEKDRIDAHNDFLINQTAEEEIRTILDHLDAQNLALNHIYDLLQRMENRDTVRPEDGELPNSQPAEGTNSVQ